MKKTLAFLLAMTMVAGLTVGCGKEKAEQSADTGKVTTEDTTKGTDTDDAAAPAEITVWAWDKNFNGKAMEEADKLDDNVKVNFVEMSKADCLQKIHTTLASGVTDDLPDIVLIGDLAAQGYLMSYPGAFMPMDNVIKYSDFADYKTAAVAYDGVGYGVPFDTGVAGLFYRSDYMSEIGVTAEDMNNLTWDQYLALGDKLKEKGHLLQTYNPNDIAEFQIMLQSAGRWYTDKEGKPDFETNDALKECFAIFDKLNKSDYCKVVSDWTEFTGAFNGGDVACVLRGSWISSSIQAAEDQSGKWAVAPIPKMSTAGAVNRSNQGGSSWYVLQNSKNSKAAAQFLADTFAGNTELYNVLLQSNIMGTYLPASTVSAYEGTQAFYGDQKVNAALASWIPEIPAVNIGAFSSEAQAALAAVTPAFLSGKDLESCLKEAASQFEQTIQ